MLIIFSLMPLPDFPLGLVTLSAKFKIRLTETQLEDGEVYVNHIPQEKSTFYFVLRP